MGLGKDFKLENLEGAPLLLFTFDLSGEAACARSKHRTFHFVEVGLAKQFPKTSPKQMFLQKASKRRLCIAFPKNREPKSINVGLHLGGS